jgi:hypothetical protein
MVGLYKQFTPLFTWGDDLRGGRTALGLPLRPPASILHRVRLRHIALLRLGFPVEVAARHMIDAPLARISREVALDRVRERTLPGALRGDAWTTGRVLSGGRRGREEKGDEGDARPHLRTLSR